MMMPGDDIAVYGKACEMFSRQNNLQLVCTFEYFVNTTILSSSIIFSKNTGKLLIPFNPTSSSCCSRTCVKVGYKNVRHFHVVLLKTGAKNKPPSLLRFSPAKNNDDEGE